MKGLILKDLLLIKGNARYILIFLVIFGLIALEGNDVLYFIPAFISMMMFMTTFSYDEYNKWDAYAITLPIKKENIVLSKYVGSTILLGIALILTFIISLVVGLVTEQLDMQKNITLLLGCGGAVLLVEAIMYPLLIKFGVEKGRIWVFLGIFLSSFIIGFIFQKVSLTIPENLMTFLSQYLPWILAAALLLILIISYTISKKLYLKKEF
mgnify:FL=1